MNIEDVVTTEYVSFDQSTRVSKLVGAFTDHDERVVVVTGDDGFEGVVTQRQLLASKHDPNERIRNVMRDDPPRVDHDEDVRETARLMVESELKLLPVFDHDEFVGVVTARDIAAAVRPNLDALDVADVYTQDLVTVDDDASMGQVLSLTRNHGISRVPVVSAYDAGGGTTLRTVDGMVSIYDLVEFVVRSVGRQQGGDTAGFDNHGGEGSFDGYRTHTGWGDRAGEQADLVDLPVTDVMTAPVITATPADSLGDAVEQMFEHDYSSLVVVDDAEEPVGIVTLTDVMRALTWEEEEEELRIQIFGIDLLTGMGREDVARLVQEVDGKYAAMDVIEAYVVLQRHRERNRGVPLVRATIRLFTNKGRIAGTGEEYGAGPAIRAAKENLERNVLDEKEHDTHKQRRKQRNNQEDVERMLGWWLEA